MLAFSNRILILIPVAQVTPIMIRAGNTVLPPLRIGIDEFFILRIRYLVFVNIKCINVDGMHRLFVKSTILASHLEPALRN